MRSFSPKAVVDAFHAHADCPAVPARLALARIRSWRSIRFFSSVLWIVWLIGNPMFRSTFPGAACACASMSSSANCKSCSRRRFRHLLSAPRACRFPGFGRLPGQVCYRRGESWPGDGRSTKVVRPTIRWRAPLHEHLGLGIELGSGFVQDQNRGVCQDRRVRWRCVAAVHRSSACRVRQSRCRSPAEAR